MTATAEQFGTNLRVTTATVVPNLVHVSAMPITGLFLAMSGPIGVENSALITGGLVFACSIVSVALMEESAQNTLEYVEP